MELAVAALGSVLTGGGAMAGAASTALTVLQGVGTVVSVLGTLGAGAAAAAQANAQADVAMLEAGQEQNQQIHRSIQMKQELARVLGENDVAFAAAGIDVSGGIAASAATTAKKRAAQEISIDRRDSEFRKSVLGSQARNLRKKASATQGGALLGAIGSVADFGIDLVDRG
ncbi:hypothetical protein AAFN47_26905 [Hoeflea sp. CAU 1731]